MANRLGIGQVSVANTNLDGTGTLADIFSAGSAGSLISRVEVRAAGNTTNGMIRLFVYDGTNTRLWQEITITGTTPSATTQAASGNVTPSPSLPLKNGWTLKASTHNAETFNVFAYGFDN